MLIYQFCGIPGHRGAYVYARGSDKNEAWAKLGFEGYLVDSMTQEEFDEKFAPPEVL